MSDTTVSKYKWFWADQDIEQEQWLRSMARQGLHLKQVIAIRWTFVKGNPADVVYRVDYSDKGKNSDYNRLLEDAGWECAASSAGWHYWRKAVVAGNAPEIFTDNKSKMTRFGRVLAITLLCGVPSALMLPRMATELPMHDVVLFGVIYCTLLYAAIRLLLRIRRLHTAG